MRLVLALSMLFAVCCTSNGAPTTEDEDADSDAPYEQDETQTTEDAASDATGENDQDGEQEGAFLDCPAPLDVSVFVSVRPFTEEESFTLTGQVTAVEKEADGNLLLTIDFTASGGEPNVREFRIPIPEGADVDLYPGDAVDVEYSNVMTPWMPSTDLAILKNGETIVRAGKCTHQCLLGGMVFPPLSFSRLSGRCEPQPEWEGCALYERLGYSVSCESMVDPMEVFDHGYGLVPCGPGYHVIVETFDRFVEFVHVCTDLPDSREEIIVIKHGNGLAGPSP